MNTIVCLIMALLFLFNEKKDDIEYIMIYRTWNFGPHYIISTDKVDLTVGLKRGKAIVPVDLVVSQKCYNLIKDYIVQFNKYGGKSKQDPTDDMECPPSEIEYIKNDKIIFKFLILAPKSSNKFYIDLLESLKSSKCNNDNKYLITKLKSCLCRKYLNEE